MSAVIECHFRELSLKSNIWQIGKIRQVRQYYKQIFSVFFRVKNCKSLSCNELPIFRLLPVWRGCARVFFYIGRVRERAH